MEAKEFLSKNGFNGFAYSSCIQQLLVDFAKYHVALALEAASEKVKIKIRKGVMSKTPTMWDVDINKESILTSYPLENIK